MDSINNWVLSFFASNDRFNTQFESLRRRYQTLNIIYINLLILVLASICISILAIVSQSPVCYFLALEILPLLCLNLVLVRKKKLEAANIVLALALLASNQIATDYLNHPMTALAGLMIYPYILLFSNASTRVLIFNMIVTFWRFYSSSMQVYRMFEVSIGAEQTEQILAFLGVGMVVSCGISLLAILQKLLESKVWSIAQENIHKCENLTKEMILAMEAKDRFISMISHEIRNPLNTLKGSVDYLLQVEVDPNHIKILKSAQLSGEILLNLVNNVLDAAKLRSDKMDIHRCQTNFVDIVRKVFMVNSELLKTKKLVAKAHIDENLPQDIWIDPSRLLQVLLNLMSNAVKFTPKGGKIEIYAEWCVMQENKSDLLKPIIELGNQENPLNSLMVRRRQEEDQWNFSETQEMTAEELICFNQKFDEMLLKHETTNQHRHRHPSYYQAESDPWELDICKIPSRKGPLRPMNRSGGGYLKIQIIDTGSGIPANEIPKLFGMFEQATEHSRSEQGGSGLGLWICKQICQKMNGDITIYSELGKGSAFVLYIPVHNKNIVQSSRSLIEGPSPVGNHRKNNELRALVVDDFMTNRYIHQLLLEQLGVQVATAADGKEALEKYKTVHQEKKGYNFILMDVNMPVMDGFTAAKKIRNWEMENNKKQTDIYFVTGEYFNEADVLTRFKNVGGSNSGIKYLNKPVDRETLQKIVIQYN